MNLLKLNPRLKIHNRCEYGDHIIYKNSTQMLLKTQENNAQQEYGYKDAISLSKYFLSNKKKEYWKVELNMIDINLFFFSKYNYHIHFFYDQVLFPSM